MGINDLTEKKIVAFLANYFAKFPGEYLIPEICEIIVSHYNFNPDNYQKKNLSLRVRRSLNTLESLGFITKIRSKNSSIFNFCKYIVNNEQVSRNDDQTPA